MHHIPPAFSTRSLHPILCVRWLWAMQRWSHSGLLHGPAVQSCTSALREADFRTRQKNKSQVVLRAVRKLGPEKGDIFFESAACSGWSLSSLAGGRECAKLAVRCCACSGECAGLLSAKKERTTRKTAVRRSCRRLAAHMIEAQRATLPPHPSSLTPPIKPTSVALPSARSSYMLIAPTPTLAATCKSSLPPLATRITAARHFRASYLHTSGLQALCTLSPLPFSSLVPSHGSLLQSAPNSRAFASLDRNNTRSASSTSPDPLPPPPPPPRPWAPSLPAG